MKLVLEYLEETTSKFSEKIAIIEEENKVTYKELLESSKIIGSNLIDKASLNEPVIVFMDKGITTLELFFGILYAGACYSLVNPDFPEARVKTIKGVLESEIVITNKENFEKAKKISY